MTQQTMYPVDVISYSGADGEIRPLRVRIPGKDSVGRVCRILQSGENRVLGAESVSFLCSIYFEGAETAAPLTLKYHVRSRCWFLSRQEGSFFRCASGAGDV